MSATYQETTWEVQANYGYGDGYECVFAALTRKDAWAELQHYLKNDMSPTYRLRRVIEDREYV